MKVVKKITFGVVCIGLFALNYRVFSRQFGFYNILLFSVLAVVATVLQALLFIMARNVVCIYRQKTNEGGSAVVLRLLAKGLDYFIALLILLLVGLISTCFPRCSFLDIPTFLACLYLFCGDSVTKEGSLGKQVSGLRLEMTDQSKKRCPLYVSAVRNFCPALFAILMVALAGEESRYNVALNWLFLVVFITAVLDVVYLKKTGIRFLDQKLGVTVEKLPSRKKSRK